MTKLVVGRFDNIDAVKRVLEVLPREGFAASEFGMFYTAPPGQHAILPTGGDADSDEGAKEAGKGAVSGAAIGGTAGLALGAAAAIAFPIAGIAAALAAAGIGAYVGSLHGAMSQTGPADETNATDAHPVEQPGGPKSPSRSSGRVPKNGRSPFSSASAPKTSATRKACGTTARGRTSIHACRRSRSTQPIQYRRRHARRRASVRRHTASFRGTPLAGPTSRASSGSKRFEATRTRSRRAAPSVATVPAIESDSSYARAYGALPFPLPRLLPPRP